MVRQGHRVVAILVVLAMTLAVTMPALADTPIPGHPDFAISDNGVLVEGRDVVLGKCSTLLQERDELSRSRYESDREAVKACEAAGYSAPLTKTGGLPVILVPIALLVVGGFLIRKSTAL